MDRLLCLVADLQRQLAEVTAERDALHGEVQWDDDKCASQLYAPVLEVLHPRPAIAFESLSVRHSVSAKPTHDARLKQAGKSKAAKKRQRFVIEGTWTGYRSSQQRVCHRTVHDGALKKMREWAEKTHSIRFTDGTSLLLNVRDCKRRECVTEIHGYDSLIRDCFVFGVNSVSALPKDI